MGYTVFPILKKPKALSDMCISSRNIYWEPIIFWHCYRYQRYINKNNYSSGMKHNFLENQMSRLHSIL